jgi:hypothetical protein
MKYVTLWEMDMDRFPADPVESGKIMMKLIDMTKQWQQANPDGEWGAFIGENKGYSTGAKSAEEIMKINMMFKPYVHFKVYQAMSIDEVEAGMKSLMQMPPM